jgi:hypothetical protein
MSLISIASAKGSPGVTTAALLFGALWPRPCLVAECDAAGGDIALRMPSEQGQPLSAEAGLVALSAAGRKAMYADLVPQHTQHIVGGLGVLTGVSLPEQAGGVAWPDLAHLFSTSPGTDVIADLGRIGGSTPQNALLAASSLVVLVTDAIPSSVIHLRERAVRVHQNLGGPLAAPIHVVVVAPPRRARAVREVRDALERARVPFEDVHHLADDPVGANFFLGQVQGRPDRTALVRSAGVIVERMAARTAGAFVADEAAGVPLQQPEGPGVTR